MLSLRIPGFGDLSLEHVVLDYNGTLAEDGALAPGVRSLLTELSDTFTVHVVTGDTFGRAAAELAGLPMQLTILPTTDQAEAKLHYVKALDANHVVAIGNGRNDRKMLEAAALGIAVVHREGSALAAITAADIVVTSILDALELIRHPMRLTATLRS